MGAARVGGVTDVVRPRLRRAGATLLLLAMTVVIGAAALRTGRSVSQLGDPVERALSQLASERLLCLEALLRDSIPAGATVFEVDPVTVRSQRISELLTPGYRHVQQPVPGAYAVLFRSPGPCSGVGVSVTRTEGP